MSVMNFESRQNGMYQKAASSAPTTPTVKAYQSRFRSA